MSKPIITSPNFRLRAVALAASCSLLLVGCGGGSGSSSSGTMEPEPPRQGNLAAIQAAKTTLTAAQNAFTNLNADATDQEKLAAQQAIHTAATQLIDTLNDNQGSQEDITAAEMARDAAQGMVTDLMAKIAEAERMQMVADQTQVITDALTALNTALAALSATDPTDEQVQAVRAARAILEAAVDEGPLATAQSKVDARVAIATSKIEIDNAERRIQMAMQQQEAITAAETELTTAEAALTALPADATDQQKLAAQQAIHTAATKLINTLRSNQGSEADINAAIAKQTSAQTMITQLQGAIADAAAERKRQRMAAITAAETELTAAEAALTALPADATDKQKLAAQKAIHTAATTLIATLQANQGSQEDINAATVKKAVAESMITQLNTAIAAAAAEKERQMMAKITAAETELTKAEEDLTELGDAATDQQKLAAQQAIYTAATTLIATLQANQGSQEDITAATAKQEAAQAMITQLNTAIAAADAEKERQDMITAKRTAITDALRELNTALAALSTTDPTTEQVNDVSAKKDALQKALEDTPTSLIPNGDSDRTAAVVAIGIAEGRITTANNTIASKNDTAQQNKIDMAKKLFNGITKRVELTGATRRDAQYGTDDNNKDKIQVLIGTDSTDLSEDKDTAVPELYGWMGKRYHAEPDDGGTYEAHVYSNAKVVEGKKFGRMATPSGDYKYELNSDGRYALASELANNIKAKSSEFPQAGTKTIERPDDSLAVEFNGTYDGVQGTYRCAVVAADNTCTVTVGTSGFTFAVTGTNSAWFFKPTNPNDKVKSDPSTNFVSYGWWLHKTENEKEFHASSFTDLVVPGQDPLIGAASGVDALNGSATYSGGAAGKYAFYNPLNESQSTSGHFTAKVELKANFDSDTAADRNISGTINTFKDGNNNSLNWSVKLQGLHGSTLRDMALLSDTGTIDNQAVTIGSVDSTSITPVAVWTIGGTAASHTNSQWALQLYNSVASGETLGGDNTDAPEVGTGTFYTEYGGIGKMVGAFGVNLDE